MSKPFPLPSFGLDQVYSTLLVLGSGQGRSEEGGVEGFGARGVRYKAGRQGNGRG